MDIPSQIQGRVEGEHDYGMRTLQDFFTWASRTGRLDDDGRAVLGDVDFIAVLSAEPFTPDFNAIYRRHGLPAYQKILDLWEEYVREYPMT